MCGAVRYECSAEQASFAAICYCTDCQRESGSAFTANMVVPSASFKLTRGELRYYERIAESGNKVSRGFCADCGVSIVNHPEMLNDMAAIRVGSLDDAKGARRAVRSVLQLPLSVEGQAVGALVVVAYAEAAFTEDDARTLEVLANQAGQAVRRLQARLLDERRKMALMVEAMADGLVMTDGGSEVFLINPAARRLLPSGCGVRCWVAC